MQHYGTTREGNIDRNNLAQDNVTATVEEQQSDDSHSAADEKASTNRRTRKQPSISSTHFARSSSKRPIFVKIFAGAGNVGRSMFRQGPGLDLICISTIHPKFTAIGPASEVLGSQQRSELHNILRGPNRTRVNLIWPIDFTNSFWSSSSFKLHAQHHFQCDLR